MNCQSDGEVPLHDQSVLPGYLYNATTKEFSPSKDAENVSIEDLPISFSFELWDNQRMIDLQKNLEFKGVNWVKDYGKESFADAVLVKGVKVLVRKGINVPLHHATHRVTSLYFKYHAHMLMMFSQAIPKESLKKLHEHLLTVVCNANESIIPETIWKCWKCAYIYPCFSKPGDTVTSASHGLKEFCRIMTESQVSLSPITAFVKAPYQSVVKLNTAFFEKSRDTGRAVKGQLDDAHCNNTSKNNNVAYDNNKTKNSTEEAPVIHSKTNTCPARHHKEDCVSCESGRDYGTRQRVSGSHTVASKIAATGRVLGTMQGRGVVGSISSETESSGETRRDVGISHQESGNRASEEDRQKYGTLTNSHPSNMETTFTSKNKSANIVSTGKKEGINYLENECPDQQWQEEKTVELSELTKDKKSRGTEDTKDVNHGDHKKNCGTNAALESCDPKEKATSTSYSQPTSSVTISFSSSETAQTTYQSSYYNSSQDHRNDKDVAMIHCRNTVAVKGNDNVQSEVTHKENGLCNQKCASSTTANSHSSTGNMEFLKEEMLKARTEVGQVGEREISVKDCKISQITSQGKDCHGTNIITQSKNNDRWEETKLNHDPQKEDNRTVRDKSPENILIKDGNKTFQNRDQYFAKNKTEKEDKQMISTAMDEKMFTHKAHEKEEKCASSSGNDSNVSRAKAGEKEEKYISTTDKNGKLSKDKVQDATKKHSKSDITKCEQGCSTKKAEEGLKIDRKVDPRKESQTFSKDNSISAKDNDTVLKITTQASANSTKKPKREKEKHKMLKSNFLNPKTTVNDSCGLERKYYGIMNNEHPEKVILLLGASGSGKTMLVNFIANYFLGKKAADDDLIHVENTAPTSAITAYTFCSGNDEITITIIDTPGLNDSSGAEVRDHVQSLKKFLASASSKDFEIHAIGFVAQAYLVRLTSSERLVMDYVSTMFGQSVSEHLITFVTFADNQDSPPIIEAMKNYGVNSKLFLKFNNSALNNTKSDEVDDLDRAYWRICWRNWRKCLKTVRDLPALGVNTMKAVQSEVYAATVIESAEKDLLAELKTFFTYCKKGNCISKDALQVCEKIWELGAIVHRLRHVQNTASYTLDNIITESSLEACKVLNISPEKYVGNLSLSPSGPLVVSGSAIVRTMAPLYKFAKHFNPDTISKSITEWAHCHRCNEEHKMNRYEITGVKKFIPGTGLSTDVLALKCEQCKCPGATHGVSSVKSPLRLVNILRHTQDCLKKSVNQYCLPAFPVEAKIFLEFLNQHFHLEHQEFILDLLRMTK